MLQIVFETSSKDFNGPSLKVVPSSIEEGVRVGQLAQDAIANGVNVTVGERFARFELRPKPTQRVSS